MRVRSRQLASVYPQAAEHTTLYVADQDKALLALEWATAEARAGGAPPVLVLPGIDTVRVRGWSLFRLGHSYVAEDASVLRDIRAAAALAGAARAAPGAQRLAAARRHARRHAAPG